MTNKYILLRNNKNLGVSNIMYSVFQVRVLLTQYMMYTSK